MSNLDIQYQNDRATYVNEANHYNGRDGYHQSTNTMYNNGKAEYSYSPYSDSYRYYK